MGMVTVPSGALWDQIVGLKIIENMHSVLFKTSFSLNIIYLTNSTFNVFILFPNEKKKMLNMLEFLQDKNSRLK